MQWACRMVTLGRGLGSLYSVSVGHGVAFLGPDNKLSLYVFKTGGSGLSKCVPTEDGLAKQEYVVPFCENGRNRGEEWVSRVLNRVGRLRNLNITILNLTTQCNSPQFDVICEQFVKNNIFLFFKKIFRQTRSIISD